MEEMIKLIVGILILILGVSIGVILAKHTKEELKQGRKWFRLLVLIGLVGGFLGLIIGNDVLLFSMFFIAIVSSQSLNKIR